MTDSSRPSRSLILAGGGLKVAFQAGVLQVWLDEAKLEFDHVDGASGGLFNMAMYCQGMSGTEIADNWRALPILRGFSPNWRKYWKLYFADSILSYRRWRTNIHTHWRLDWDKIRASNMSASFNLYNFTTHQLEVWDTENITEDALISGVSLPMWFPPVRINGHDYIDAVYASDANVIEAVRRGADELWVIWTVSERSIWRNGFLANYFQIIETAANGRFRCDLARIEKNNAAINAGEHSEFGREIVVRILRAEVPLHYILNFSSKRFTEAVELGVQLGRQWCLRHGIETDGADAPAAVAPETTYLEFRETMKGDIVSTSGEAPSGEFRLTVRLTIQIDDIDAFVGDPQHPARASGYVESDLLGGRHDVSDGDFNLFVDQSDNKAHKRMLYRLPFVDHAGAQRVLVGHKEIFDDPGFDLWSDTTTLFLTIDEPAGGEKTTAIAEGVIRIRIADFLKQLMTFRAKGPDIAAEIAALGKFGKLFLGSLWVVYSRFARRKLHHRS